MGVASHPNSDHRMPRWVKLFSVVAVVVVAAFALLHLGGMGMGHMAHNHMDARAHASELSHMLP